MSEIPSHIGPCEFGMLGRQVAVRCPRQFDSLMRNAGGQWEAGSRRWLIERRRIGPVIRALSARLTRCSGELVSIWTTSRAIFAVWPLSLEPRRRVGRRGPSPRNLPRRPAT